MTDKTNVEEQGKNKIFDDAFATMVEEYPEILIPAINEVFHTSYSENQKVSLYRDEHHEKDGKIITDIYAGIEDSLYHVECQSREDEEMEIRMLRYDFAIAWKNAIWEDGYCEVNFPKSCVLYLRSRKKTPDALKVKLVLQDGQTVFYTSPIIKVKEYGKDEIFQKNLMLFLPFYIMRYEEEIQKQNKAELDKMYREVDQILGELDQCRAQAKRKGVYITVNELFREVSNYMVKGKQECKKRMDKIMGGHVLELESIKILRQGREEGRAEGREEGRTEGRTEGAAKQLLSNISGIMSKLNLSLEEACDVIGVTVEQYEAAKKLSETIKDDTEE